MNPRTCRLAFAVLLASSSAIAAGEVASPAALPSSGPAAIVSMEPSPNPVAAAANLPHCDTDNAGLTLPPGFCALVYASTFMHPRHLVVTPDGDVIVAIGRSNDTSGGVLVLRDENGDGRADKQVQFDSRAGTGIGLFDGHLYFAPNDSVVRWPWPAGQLVPSGPAETIVSNLLFLPQHAAKSIAFGPGAVLYVNVGAPSNACQDPDRTPGVPGRDPCPLLANSGGIWRFDAKREGQTQAGGTRFASGLRNTVALAVHPGTGVLYGASHGRDGLSTLWPDLYDDRANAEGPAEEFFRIDEGDDLGWPYCYFDLDLGKTILNPEYGGDAKTAGRCEHVEKPAVAFPAHWAPIAIAFPTDSRWPEKYRDGAFVSFRGSWNRAPLPQDGYNVSFAPFEGGAPNGTFEVFAKGFAGETPTPRGPHRPTGIAFGPDGSMYVSDDTGGRIYRIVYRGE
jgi:glucose/arabinose dehydrogenase